MVSANPNCLDDGPIGLIAGQGELPLLLAKKLKQEGRELFIILVKGEADPSDYKEFSTETVAITKIGKFLKLLKQNNCRTVTLCGPVNRPNFKNILPDAQGMKLLTRIGGALSKGDDGLLRAITEFIEENGFKVVGPHELENSFLTSSGTLGTYNPTEQDLDDIAKGREVLEVIGRLDIGQAVVVRNGYVLAVEAAEGTKSMLERCSTLKWEEPAGVLVKLPKPEQELRADMPAIGVATVSQARKAGLKGIAIEAENTLLIDKDNIIKAADDAGLFLFALSRKQD